MSDSKSGSSTKWPSTAYHFHLDRPITIIKAIEMRENGDKRAGDIWCHEGCHKAVPRGGNSLSPVNRESCPHFRGPKGEYQREGCEYERTMRGKGESYRFAQFYHDLMNWLIKEGEDGPTELQISEVRKSDSREVDIYISHIESEEVDWGETGILIVDKNRKRKPQYKYTMVIDISRWTDSHLVDFANSGVRKILGEWGQLLGKRSSEKKLELEMAKKQAAEEEAKKKAAADRAVLKKAQKGAKERAAKERAAERKRILEKRRRIEVLDTNSRKADSLLSLIDELGIDNYEYFKLLSFCSGFPALRRSIAVGGLKEIVSSYFGGSEISPEEFLSKVLYTNISTFSAFYNTGRESWTGGDSSGTIRDKIDLHDFFSKVKSFEEINKFLGEEEEKYEEMKIQRVRSLYHDAFGRDPPESITNDILLMRLHIKDELASQHRKQVAIDGYVGAFGKEPPESMLADIPAIEESTRIENARKSAAENIVSLIEVWQKLGETLQSVEKYLKEGHNLTPGGGVDSNLVFEEWRGIANFCEKLIEAWSLQADNAEMLSFLGEEGPFPYSVWHALVWRKINTAGDTLSSYLHPERIDNFDELLHAIEEGIDNLEHVEEFRMESAYRISIREGKKRIEEYQKGVEARRKEFERQNPPKPKYKRKIGSRRNEEEK